MRLFRPAVPLLLSLLAFSAPCLGQYLTYSVYVDSDDNSATGCTVALTESGATLTGVESVLAVSITSTSPPTIAGITRSTCTNGSFGPGVSEGTAAYEPGAGANGADSIELSDSLSALVGSSASKVRLYVVDGTVANGAPVAAGVVTANAILDADVLTTSGAAPGAPVLLPVGGATPPTAVAVPLGWPVLLLLAGVLLVFGARAARKRALKRMLVALALYSGVAGAAIFNWSGIAPLATDATGDAIGNATILDLHYFYAAVNGGNVYFRIDLAGAGFSTVTAAGDGNETISPGSVTVLTGAGSATFTVTANTSYTVSTTVGGTCPVGAWNGNQYTTGAPIVGNCTVLFSAALTPTPTIHLTVAGDSIHLNGATAASTVNLTGADLTAYPAATYGTLAKLVAAGTTSVIDSSGNFTLDASGNGSGTTFNFGTGAVSGADAASSTGITYAGVTTYITSTSHDIVTLSAPSQNVTAANDSQTVNLGSLNYTGTLNFSAGSGGIDTVNAAVGGNLSGGTIVGVSPAVAKIALVLNAAGTETLSTAQYNTITSITGGSITFTGGTFGANTIAFSDAGTVTATSGAGNYVLSSSGNSITLTNPADNVTGAASGNDTVNLAALGYIGATAFGSTGSDTINVTVGGNISGGTITSGGATVALVLSGAGMETLNVAEYNLFTATGIVGGTFAGNTITFSDAGTVTANSNVANYVLSPAGNAITLNDPSDNVTGAASGNNVVAIPQFSYAGTIAFGASGTDIVQAPTNGDFSGLTLTSSGAILQLMITGVASGVPSGSTTTTEVYNQFTSGPHAGGVVYPAGGDTNPADYIIAFSDQGAVTDSAGITNYYLNASVHSTINDIYAFTIANNSADNVTEFSAATGGSTYNIDVPSFTGRLSLGSSGMDTVRISADNDISGGQITSSGTAVALSITGSGTVTVSSAEAALFHAAPSPIAAGGFDSMNIADATSPIDLTRQENALTDIGLQAGANTVNVSVGAASVNAGAAGFNHTISENGAGDNTFNIDNAAATIIGASDASHYVTINNFNTASDDIALTLSGVAQDAGEQDISDSGNDTITVPNNGVIVETDLGALPGFTVADATNLSSAASNILKGINASSATLGQYTFVLDTNDGAAIYQIHVNPAAGTIDGIQLIAVIHGVGAFNLINRIN